MEAQLPLRGPQLAANASDDDPPAPNSLEKFASYEYEDLMQGAQELISLARVVEQQNRLDEADEIYQSALARLDNILQDPALASNDQHREAAEQLLEQVSSSIAGIRVDLFEHHRQVAEELAAQGEHFATLEQYAAAKDCFIDSCDLFMELEAEAMDREVRTTMSLRVMELLNRAEQMTEMLMGTTGSVADNASLNGPLPSHRDSGEGSEMPLRRRSSSWPITVDSPPVTINEEESELSDMDSLARLSTEPPHPPAFRGRAGTIADHINQAHADRHSTVDKDSNQQSSSRCSSRESRSLATQSHASNTNTRQQIAALMTEQDEMAQQMLSQISGAAFDFATSTDLHIEDSDHLASSSTPVKRSILGLVGFSLQSLGTHCPLRALVINSFELQINSALEQSLGVGLSRLRQLTELDLSHSGLNARGCELLCDSMAANQSLVTLVLDFNTVGDMGVSSICRKLLSKSESLRLLSLKSNGIGPEGSATLREQLETGTSLYRLDIQGNHIGCEEVDRYIIGDKSQVTLITDKHEPPRGRGAPTCKVPHVMCRHVQLLALAAFGETDRRGTRRKKRVARKRTSEDDTLRMQTANQPAATTPASAMSVALNGVTPNTRGARSSVDGSVEPSSILPSVTTAELQENYAATFKEAIRDVTTPNILLIGQRLVGKHSVINAAFGANLEREECIDPARPVEYRDNGGAFAMWDTVSLDPSDELDASLGIGQLIAQQFKLGHLQKLVHAIWYVVSSPVWQALDENYLKQFARRAVEAGCPLFVIINKADTMTPSQLQTLRDSCDRALKSSPCYRGTFTCVADTRPLEHQLTMQLRTAGCPDAVFDSKLQVKLDDELDARHCLPEVLQMSCDLLKPTVAHCLRLSHLSSLRRKELTAADIVRNQQSKFEQGGAHARLKTVLGGRGRRWAHVQLTKMLRRVAIVFDILPSHISAGDEPELGREFTKLLGDSYVALTAASGHLDLHSFTTLSVLWILNVKQYRVDCMETALQSDFAVSEVDRSSAFAAILRKCRVGREIVMQLYAVVTKHIVPETSESENLGRRPGSIVILRIMEECSGLLFGNVSEGQHNAAAKFVKQPSTDDHAPVEYVVEMLCQPRTSTEVWDGFLASYRTTFKIEPADLLATFERHFAAHAYSENATSRTTCERVCEFVAFWLQHYFRFDFVTQELAASKDSDSADFVLEAAVDDLSSALPDNWPFGNDMRPNPALRRLHEFVGLIKGSPHAVMAPSLVRTARHCSDNLLEAEQSSPLDHVQLSNLRLQPMRQFDAQLLAAHLTFVNFSRFAQMSLRDLFASASVDRTAFIKHANQITYWLVDCIVSCDDIETRTRILLKCIEMADFLQGPVLRDYQGFMAVMTALQLSHVARLKHTWARARSVHPVLIDRFEAKLAPLAEPGNGMYNTIMDRVVEDPRGPCVPFLGSFLTGIERTRTTGNAKATVSSKEAAHVHFETTAKLATMLAVIPKCQDGDYPWSDLGLLPSLDQLFRHTMCTMYDFETRATRNALEDRLNAKSLTIEPRNGSLPSVPRSRTSTDGSNPCRGSVDAVGSPEVMSSDDEEDIVSHRTRRFSALQNAPESALAIVVEEGSSPPRAPSRLSVEEVPPSTTVMPARSRRTSGERGMMRQPNGNGHRQSVRRLLSANESTV